ncbi:MAG: HAD family hydrolase [Bacillota bacterium]|jgi:FMN phosphatase YigB (HAD superfamily)
MEKAILFDLDGTLCRMDERVTEFYLNDMGQDFLDVLPEGEFFPNIMKSTYWAIKNPSLDKSCYEVCLQHFCQRYQLDYADVDSRMKKFYHERYPKYGKMVDKIPLAPEVVKAAKKWGWLTILASNALMPQTAMQERIRWCGIDPVDFDLIPGIDTMHFAKPTLQFYKELMQKAAISDPRCCLMVGNSPQEDMIAADVGMETFLVMEEGIMPDLSKAKYHGNLQDLLNLINKK